MTLYTSSAYFVYILYIHCHVVDLYVYKHNFITWILDIHIYLAELKKHKSINNLLQMEVFKLNYTSILFPSLSIAPFHISHTLPSSVFELIRYTNKRFSNKQ